MKVIDAVNLHKLDGWTASCGTRFGRVLIAPTGISRYAFSFYPNAKARAYGYREDNQTFTTFEAALSWANSYITYMETNHEQ